MAAAKREADEIRKRAEIEASQMVSEDRVMNQARQKANELVAQAEAKAKEVPPLGQRICEDVLRRTEEALAEAHSEMRQVRSPVPLRRGRPLLRAGPGRQQPYVRRRGGRVRADSGKVDIKNFMTAKRRQGRPAGAFLLP